MSGDQKYNKNAQKRQKAPVDTDNPILKAFSQIGTELDEKHDRHERIIKISRDITIESKRVIFLLHTVDPL